MMFAKTICNPGSYVEIVPQGLLAKLQYNHHGLLEKIYLSYEEGAEAIDPATFRSLSKLVPATISLTGGTTWVYGVFYSDEIARNCGELPYCTIPGYLDQLEQGRTFTFYGGNAESLACAFSGSLSIRNWLSMSKFNLLPGIVVPSEMTEDTIKVLINSGAYHFKYPYIAGYFVFDTATCEFIYSGLKQCTVLSIQSHLNDQGYYHSVLKTDADPELFISYSDTVSCNVQEGSFLLYYDDPFTIIDSVPSDKASAHPVSREITCPVCHKTYMSPLSGPVRCDDPHCMSVEYDNSVKLLNTLGLPTISAKRYWEAVENKELTCLSDVLVLPEYKEAKISVTLDKAIQSVVPVEVTADASFFSKLANSCNGSVETFMYYVEHPLRIETELNMTSIPARRFISWIDDPENVLLLRTILTSVNIQSASRKFEGSPIFRNVHFTISGRFKHGNHEDVKAILESYSAIVSEVIDVNSTNTVIIGSMHEGIDGGIIQQARAHGIHVVEEDEFFAQYNIDQDLASNLL